MVAMNDRIVAVFGGTGFLGPDTNERVEVIPPRRRKPLTTVASILREQARLYREVRNGRLAPEDGTRLVYMLREARSTIESLAPAMIDGVSGCTCCITSIVIEPVAAGSFIAPEEETLVDEETAKRLYGRASEPLAIEQCDPDVIEADLVVVSDDPVPSRPIEADDTVIPLRGRWNLPHD
jgi:hypothetical protein